MVQLNHLEVPKSLKEIALNALKKAIFHHELESGTLYNERMLSKQFGISRSPVREALLELSTRGLINYIPRKGFKIASLNEEQTRQIWQFRKMLEIGVVELLIPNLTSKALDELSAAHQQCIDYPDELVLYDRKFHFCMAELAENEYLMNALKEIRDLIECSWAGKIKVFTERHQTATEEHRLVIDALKNKDVNKAKKAMADHIQRGCEFAVKTL